jgi:hypothetical protein
MADLRFNDKNNQKKVSSVFASGIITTSATMSESLFTLPEAALVTSVYAYVKTGSGTATDTVDVKVGSTVIANEVVVGTTGTKAGVVTPTYFPTGGLVTVVAGADVPGTTGEFKLIVEYIETELSNGTYTD